MTEAEWQAIVADTADTGEGEGDVGEGGDEHEEGGKDADAEVEKYEE